MKKILLTLATAVVLFTSCEGPQGPPGLDGINILGQTFERSVNFQYNSSNNLQQATVSIETSQRIYDTDAILVYRLESEFPDEWSLIPQNFFLSGGDIIQYVYNHSLENNFRFRVNLFIDGNFNLSTLGPGFTQNQIFRFVVVPSDFAVTSGVDVQDYNAVMNALNLD